MSNNQTESYSLLKACQIAIQSGYKSIQIFGDLELLMKLLNSESLFHNSVLNKILQRIQNSLNEFEHVASFHILRDLNKRANSLANKACILAQGMTSLNGEPSSFHPIP